MNYGDFLKYCAMAGIDPDAASTAPVTPTPATPNMEKWRLVGGPNLPFSAGNRLTNTTDHKVNANTRFPHFMRSGTTEIRLVYMGFFNNGAGEQPLLNSVKFRVSLEYPQGTFFGQVSAPPSGFDLTLYPGQILITDPIPLDLKGNSPLIRHFLTVTSGQSYPTSNMFNNGTWEGSAVETTKTTDGTSQAAISSFVYNTDAYEFCFTHNAVIGKQLKRTLVVMCDGDSILNGTGTNSYLGRGWLMLITDQLYPTANLSFPSGTAAQAAVSSNTRCRLKYAEWADAVVENFGTNDFAGNAPHATVAANRIERWSMWARRGVQVAACTVFPRVTSTDNYATEANQTPLTAWLAGGNAQLHNAWIRDGAPMTGTLAAGYVAAATGSKAAGVMRAGEKGHLLGAVFDQAAVLQGTKVGTWKVLTGDQVTPDGIHVTDTGVNQIVAAPVAAQIKAWCAGITLT